jgi:glycosyltransferase involved in cell wall biosynthesis
MRFQILIPTYNRAKYLQQNLAALLQDIHSNELQTDIGVIVSDNASTDETASILASTAIEFQKSGVDLQIFRNEKNVGLEGNGVKILEQASADYVIWLGDDDFLPAGFLKYVVDKFRNDEIGWMITGAIAEYADGSRSDTYGIDAGEMRFPAGYPTIWSVSNYGHKMSGLVLRREGMLEFYLSNPAWRNLYLYISFLICNQVRYPGIFASQYRVLVNTYNKKDFDYNTVGLLDEVYKSYNYLISVYGMKKVMDLLLRFTVMHSYRVNFKSGLTSLFRQWKVVYGNYEYGASLKWPLLRLFLKEYIFQNLYSPARMLFMRSK